MRVFEDGVGEEGLEGDAEAHFVGDVLVGEGLEGGVVGGEGFVGGFDLGGCGRERHGRAPL